MKLKLTPARPAPTNPRPSNDQNKTGTSFHEVWALVQGLIR